MRGLRFSEFVADPVFHGLEGTMVRVLQTGEPQHVETYVRAPGESRERAWSCFLYPLLDEGGAVHGRSQIDSTHGGIIGGSEPGIPEPLDRDCGREGELLLEAHVHALVSGLWRSTLHSPG
jgi:hypothetical protein